MNGPDLRNWVHDVLEGTEPRWGRLAAWCEQVTILAAVTLFTLATVTDDHSYLLGELLFLIFFALEYALRVWSAPDRRAYIRSFWGIIDLIAWLPGLILLTGASTGIRVFRLIQIARLLKLTKLNSAFRRLNRALQTVRQELFATCILAGLVLYLAALGIWIFEHEVQPEAFGSLFDCVWWAVATLTTVGYGDSYPITVGGRVFTMFILVIGLAVVAVPTGLISAALVEDGERHDDDAT